MKQTKISENLTYVTSSSFTLSLDDDKQRQFGILFEMIDMYEATGEAEFKQYPYLVSAGIIADRCHKSFYEGEGKPTKERLIFDTNSYMGTIPVDHILTHAVKSSSEASNELNESNFSVVANQFKLGQATIVTQKQQFGTIAAQKGIEHEHQYLQFKTEQDAEQFIQYLIKNRVTAIGMLIGFTLDKPVNMAGKTGWSTMEKMVKGCK